MSVNSGLNGISLLLMQGLAGKLLGLLSLAALGLAVLVGLDGVEWALLVIALGLCWLAQLVNGVAEVLLGSAELAFTRPKDIADYSAAMLLISRFVAALLIAIIFWP
ncbi:diacylglycerol kinase [Spongiibacter sp. IMCC21906]|uniref:diacylglycerol kinase n=1 Tax=Spongiibacter sp. IMCC21906 TaxID=1620392 RepID=UPI0018CFC237|nr:diacylglycerol kinase [Spongiibacter sp. IMCC21906]